MFYQAIMLRLRAPLKPSLLISTWRLKLSGHPIIYRNLFHIFWPHQGCLLSTTFLIFIWGENPLHIHVIQNGKEFPFLIHNEQKLDAPSNQRKTLFSKLSAITMQNKDFWSHYPNNHDKAPYQYGHKQGELTILRVFLHS